MQCLTEWTDNCFLSLLSYASEGQTESPAPSLAEGRGKVTRLEEEEEEGEEKMVRRKEIIVSLDMCTLLYKLTNFTTLNR